MAEHDRPDHDADPPPPLCNTIPRREFLKASAAAAGATLLASCLSSSDGTEIEVASSDDPVSRFDHLVVVMFENRSLDSLLGYLYAAGQGFNGLAGGTFTNPVPPFINDGHAFVTARMSPGTDADMMNPNPDPGEPYPRINTQLFGIVDPPTNQFEAATQMKPPYNAPPAGTTPTMQGFVQDYCNTFVQSQRRVPTFDEYRVIMDSFTPEQLPVLSTLAKSFAVYDAWFCAVPSQTICNRSFFHASTSSGYVLNVPYPKWIETNTATTIFNRLQDAGRTWCVYYDQTQLVPFTALIHAPALFPYWTTHFGTMEDFYSDVATGNLPDYAFVEPRMVFSHNDYHPPAPIFFHNVPIGPTSDVRAADLLLNQIYDAIRTSASGQGSNASNTMLLVTFDEHGGCYDHVAPPGASSPQNPQPEGEMNFLFDRLGVRVPAIAISAYTAANTIVNRPVHHAAPIRTLSRKYGLAPLTDRDRGAPDLSDAINLTTARSPSTWPVITPRPVPPSALNTDPTSPELAPLPLDGLERDIVGLALAYFAPNTATIPSTLGEAYATLKPLTAGKFGRKR